MLNVLIFVGGSIALTFVCYALARRTLHKRSNEHTRDLSSSVVFRLSALHGLILALVFAQELINYNALNRSINHESNLVESVYFDLRRFDATQTAGLQKSLAEYVQVVLKEEWRLLASKRALSDKAWDRREVVLKGVLNLKTNGPSQTWLRERMLQKLAALEDERNSREISANTHMSPIFWFVALIGLALVSASFLSFQMNFANIALMAFFAIYTGIVLFFINAIDHPFEGPGRLSPVALERLFEQFLRAHL